MKQTSTIWRWVVALAALVVMTSTAFAVTDADVTYLKTKVANEQQLTWSDVLLAKAINAETSSFLDMNQVMALYTGQYRAPDPVRTPQGALDVYVLSTTDFDWTDVSGMGTAVPLGDDAQTSITLPFAFTYYDVSYTTANLASNGYLAFGTSTFSNLSNVAIPTAGEPNGMIAMFWDDLDPDNGNAGNYFTYHDAANSRFIIQGNQVQHWPSGDPETFQLILYTNGNIVLQYQTVSDASSCTIGIENLAGTEGIQICFDDGACVAANSAWLISQPDGVPNPPTNLQAAVAGDDVTLTWDDPTQDTNGNPLTPDAIEVWMGPVGTGTLLGSVGAGVETYAVSDLASGNYTFSVRAQEGAFFSGGVSAGAVVGNASYFADFEADNGDLISSGGWEWGVPSNGPPAAHSGTNCWGTLLTANYDNDACYYLDIDQQLTVGSDAATLEFWMWYASESFWDGMNIKVSVDGGATWEIVTDVIPAYNEDAMNGNDVCHADEVAWSGTTTGNSWNYYVVNLGAYAGQTPVIRFSFGSDGSVQNPGHFIDDVTLWGFGEPEFAPISGTVALDGGAGSLTAVTVQANGIGNPTTNPAANGTYTLPNVLVGNRVVTGSLTGYHDAVVPVALGAGGATGVNLMLVRLDPPVPSDLEGTVNSTSGLVELDWTASPDPLVDVYPVYRRLQGEETWVLQGSPTTNSYSQTLTGAGIYEYAVAARDNNVTTPVESDMSDPITLLYGALPPSGLGANGNYDDRIVLSWFPPGTPPEFELSYDDGTNEVQGIAWWGGAPAFGWMVAKFQTQAGPATVTRVKPFWSDDAQVPFDVAVEVAVFADAGGVPTFEPLGVTSFQKANPGDFQDIELVDPVTVTDGIMWVGVRQIGANPLGLGGDNDSPFVNGTFKYSFDATAWTAFEPNLLTIPMLRCFAIGQFGGLMELEPAPIEVSENDLPYQTIESKSGGKLSSVTLVNENALTASTTPTPLEALVARGTEAVAPHMPNIASTGGEVRTPGGALDDVVSYRVYRGGTQVGTVPFGTNTYTDLNRVENTSYVYTVTALYDNGAESAPVGPLTAMCNMEPAAPTGLQANSSGTTQMVLAWTAPTQNADATPLVDLANYRVYRDGTMIATVPAGTVTYIDTPPVNDQVYTWTVTAIDEVPNESALSNGAIGAVVSPWETMDCDWVDISGVGTPVVEGDDINSGLMPLPWDFEYYGATYSQFSICSNGWISFTSISNSLGGTIPSAAEPNAAIYGMYMDLNPFAGGTVYMYDDAANDRLIVSWVDVQQYANPTNLFSFQIILEPPTAIYISYLLVTTPSGDVGVENADGSDAIVLWDGTAGPFTPANNTCVGFWAGPSGAISGLVREFGTNTPIQGASAWVAEDPATVVTSDATGTFMLEVEPGTYELHVFKQGYCEQVFTGVQVDDGGTTTRNASLRQPNAQFSVSTLNLFCTVGDDAFSAFEITNPAPATCEVSYTVTSSQNWLTVTPAEGDVVANQSQVIAVTADVSGFSVGTYSASLTVNHNDTNNPYVIECFVEVGVPASDSPELPTEFALHANYPN
ncbi:carboxypeptidase regulatory-like domain-containing protein, partial [bacterium]|nr:carboxypeptidase regulatory-like domain-containing protein [bacterium]